MNAKWLESLVQLFTEWWQIKLLGSAGSVVMFLFGPWEAAYTALVALMVLDVITGITASVHEGRSITSAVLKSGLTKKVFLYGATLIVANLTDMAMGIDLLQPAFVGLLAATEGLSNLENLTRIAGHRHPALGALKKLLEGRLKVMGGDIETKDKETQDGKAS